MEDFAPMRSPPSTHAIHTHTGSCFFLSCLVASAWTALLSFGDVRRSLPLPQAPAALTGNDNDSESMLNGNGMICASMYLFPREPIHTRPSGSLVFSHLVLASSCFDLSIFLRSFWSVF